MSDSTSRRLNIRRAAAFAGAALAIVGLTQPWLRTGVLRDQQTYLGIDVLPLASLVVIASVAIGFALAFSFRADAQRPLTVAALVAVVAALVVSVFILLAEASATIIPTSALPTTLRRATLEVTAGGGAWVTLCAFAGVAIAASPVRPPRLVGRMGDLRKRRLTGPVALASIAVGVGAIAWARYLPWVSADAAQEGIEIPGWGLTWVGPLSLYALWIIAGGALLALLTLTQLGALVVAAAAWVVTLVSALVINAAWSVGSVPVERFLPDEAKPYGPSVHAGTGAWIAFSGGLVCAVAAGALVTTERE